MTIVTAGMEKKANAGGDLRPPCFVGDAQQCVAATEGADVIITVDLASTGGLPTVIVWRRGEQELVGDRYRVSENNNTVVLNLQNVTLDDAGHYTLTAKNSAGEARRAFEIKVEGAGSDVPVFLRRLSDLAVKVGTRTRFLVEIRCSAEVTVSWHRNNEQLLEGERFHFVHEGNFFCVDVAPVMMEDGGRWTCTAEGAGGRASCSSHLNVLVPKAYKAPEFLEELQALLTEQGTVSLECKVVGVPTPVLRWYKDGQEIKAGDVFALTANPDDPTSLGTYTCEAVNCMGKAYSSSRVHVVGKGSREGSLKPADSMKPVGPAPVFTQNLRDEKIKIGDTLTLTCQVSVPPWPQSVTWYNKEGRAEDGDRHRVMADGLGGYMMQISSAEAADEGEWKCVATSSLGARGISTCHVSMTYPKNYRKPRFLESLKAVMTEEGLVSFECKVVGFPTPQLRWFKDGEELKPGDVYQLTGTNSLGSYCCIAKNCMGQATSSAELTVEDIQNQLNEEERLQLFSTNQPPKFIVGLKSCEAKITEEFRFTVQVSISPEPSISWYRDDEQMEDTDRYRVSREALGNLHLDISSLEIIDQAEWKCVATNEFGHSVTSCFLKLIIPRHFKKPRFLESLRAILSEEGAVNLECKVIGVPQPVLKWYKDGEELKPGDIHRIISGQDGTCCLGTYTCEARNCMGTVASSASLLGFEERLMKTATQHKPEQTTGHILARNPSLSTIHEERTSQMYDTPATERSATMDERAEVSFSFDGKEVSVSLYETPDLTEEEALQVVEMYADQLSEHVSEHNVLELPPLRFVKETSNTGKLLMEAIVIDVTHDAFVSAAADDDLRTDADLEEFSITDDNGQQAPPLPQDVEQDEDALYEKLDTEFLERALAPTVSYDICEEAVAPKRPPRRKTDSSQRAKPDGDTKGSDTSTKGGVTPKDDEDRSDHFTDAVAYISEKDSYASARGSSGDAKAYKVASVEERRIGESLSTKSSPPELLRNTELCTKRQHEESQGAELEQDVAHKQAKNTEHSSRPESLKKKVRSVESGLGRSFEESVEERMGGEPPGPKPERPARKRSRSRNEKSIESGQGGSFEESGDDRTSSETSIAAHKVDRRQSQKKGASSDVGSIESYLKKIQEQESILQEAKAEDLKRSSGKGSHVSTEVQTEGSIMKKELESQQLLSLEIRDSGDTEETVERAGKQGHLSSSSVDLPTLKAAENLKSATGKGESSLIESLTRSLQGIQEGLASVEKQEQDKSTSEPGYEKSRLFLFEAQTQAIEDSSAIVEEKRALGAPYEENMSSKMLVTTSQPTQEIHKTSASVEQKPDVELREKCMPEETSVSVLENVARPVEELARDTADILQFAESTHEDTSETREEEFPELYMQSSVQTISQSIHELQRGMALLEQHIAFEDAGATTSHVDSASILATLSHPLHELRRGLAEVQQQTLLEAEEAPIGQSIMETFARPIEDLQEGLEALEQLTSLATGTTPITEPPGKTAVQFLAAPIDALKTGLSQIRHAFLIETKPSEKLPGNICVLESLQTTLQSLQDAVEIVPNISTLQETSGKVIVHDIGELRAVTLLARPLVDMQLCLNVLEITEFKSRGQPVLTTEGRDPRLDTLMGPLSGLHGQLAQIEERITAGSTRNLTSQSAHVVTVQSLLQPIRNLKRNIDVIRGIAISESTISNFDLNLLESLEKPLKEFTVTLVSIEQDAVLNVTPKQTANLNSLLTAKAVVNCIENLQETIVKVNERHTSEDQEEPEMKATSKLEKLSQPLFQIKQTLVGAVQNVLLDESKVIPESTAGNALESIVSLLEDMQKELCVIERDLITKKETEPKTKKSVETLLRPIKELQDGITATARQLTEAAPGTSGLSALESLLEPLQGLQMAITVVAPKETSLLILDSVTESFEALLRGVAATEKQVLAQAMKDPRKLSVTKLGALTEPLKELQKEISLVEQKIQFESEEQLASESSSINALSGLVQPLRELQRGLLLIEHFALEQDVKPLVQKVAGVLVEPILELQRGISSINQKATWHADAVQSKGFTILETLAQPLQVLQRALSVVEEQNIMILEEALIFEKASSLAAVEKVTESVQELHHRISSIEHFFSFETVAKRNEFVGLSDLHKIAKPLMEIHERLNQVEDYIFEAGDKPMSERAIILCLDAIAKPMKDLTTELSQVEQALTREPDSKFDQDELGPSPLQTLARPINALQCNIAVIQRLATQTETASVFQTLAQPLQDLQDGLTILQGHTAMETLAEQPTQKSSVTALHTLATSIEEIHSGIVLMKEQAGSEGLELTVSEHDAASFLEAITHPLKELQKNLGQVQHQILLEKTTEYPSDTLLLAFAIPVWELQRGLALIEQNALLESSDKPLTAVSMVQVIAQPVQEIHTALAQIHEQVLLEAPDTPVFDRSDISILKTLANPIHELQKTLAVLEHHVVLDPHEEQMSDKLGTSVLETIAQPLEELHKNLVLVEQHVLLEAGERSMSEEAGLSVLETLAHPIQELERGIAFIQHQVALEAREVEMSDKSTVSILKTLAQPLQEMQRGLLQIEEQLVMEVREEPLSEKSDLSLLKTLAKPIEEIQKSIAVIEQQVIFEANVQPFPKVTATSMLKELASPLYELQQNLVQIEQQVALEAKDEFVSELSLSVLKTVAQPIHDMQRTIALIQQQEMLEAGGEDLSDRTSMTLLQTLAQPLEELEKGIAEIQQQIALEATEEPISEDSTFSVLQSLAEPLQEICRGIAVMQECAVYEGGVETLSEKTDVSALQALAQPIQELLERIAVLQQQAPVEHCEVLSENEDMSVLMKLAQPVEELQRTLLQVEQQVALEADVGDIQIQSVPLLRKLAQPIIELQTRIALIEKQAVLESAECLSTDEGNLSLLRELAVPLQELQKGIVMIEQQELLEGPLSDDATNISDLRTSVSSADASQVLGAMLVEEQRALESETDALTARTDARELESTAVSQQEPKRNVAVVQEQTALDGNVSKLATETYEAQVALLSREMERGTATVEGLEVVQEESIENVSKEAGVETELMECKEQQQEECEIRKTEEKEAELKNKEQAEAERKRNEQEESERRKKEEEEAELKKKEQAEAERKRNEQEESERRKKEEAELKKKEQAEAERKRKDQEEAERRKKEEEEAELKEKEQAEAERKRKEQEEAERRKKEEEEAELKKKEQAEAERKRKEQEEAERRKQEEEEAELKKKEQAEAERKRKEQEEAERRKKEEEEAELKKKEQAEAERKRKEQEEAERRKKEEEKAELKKKEQAEAERKRKEQEEAERRKKEEEEAELKKKEQAEAERKRKEQEEAERRKKEEEEAELKKKEQAEAERKRKEQEEAERRKKEEEEAELKKKEQAEAERKRKEQEEAEIRKQEEEEAELKKKEQAEAERKRKEQEEAERRKKEEEEAELKNKEQAEAERKRKEQEEAERRKKEEEEAELKKKEQAEAERKRKEQEEAERRKKEEEEAERKKKEQAEAERKRKEQEEAERRKKEEEEAERRKKEEEEAELKKQEQAEAERKRKEQEEVERRKKEEEEAERRKKEEEEAERRKKDEEEAELKKKEQAEAERKRKEQEEADRRKKEEEEAERRKKEEEEAELKKQEQAEAERKRKEQEEAERRKKEEEEAELKKKEQAEAERKRKEQEEAERRKKEEEEAELKKKEQAEAERKRKEQEEAERRKKEEEEAELKKKEQAEAERKRKEQEEAERRKKEEEEAERRKKEEEEAERRKKEEEEAELKKKEQAEAERKRKEQEEAERRKKEEEEAELKKKEQAEAERKRKEQEEAERRKKEEEEAELKKKEQAEAERKIKEQEEAERRKKEEEEAELKKKEQAEAERKRKEQEEVERRKKEEEEAELKKKEQAEAERKRKEQEEVERRKKEEEEAELKKKEQAEAERKRKEQEEAERRKKEEEEAELKKKEQAEAERKRKEQEEVERRKKEEEEAELKKKEQAEAERKRKEQEEAERRKKEEEEAELKKKEQAEAERKRKEQEEVERRKKEEEEAELKKKEQAEAERKRKEQEEAERRKKEEEETELKKKEQAEAERKRKEQEEAERRKKEEEEAELKKKEQAEAERKRKEQEEAERRKKEEEEAELKKKEQAEAERKRKEQEEAERRKKEEEEAELKKKEQAEAERKRKEQEEAERRKKEEEEAERKGKEMAEKELEQTRAGGKTRKEGNKSRTVGKRKTDGKKKEREERKQDEKLLEDLKESDDSRKIKEQVEPENNEDVTENDKSRQAMQAAEDKAVESVKAEGVMLSEVPGTKETADSSASERKRRRQDAEDTEKETAKSRTASVQNDVKVEWIAEGAVQKTRSFDDRPWAEESAVGRHRQYDDALDSSDTITYSSTSSTLTPTQHTLGRTEGTRRIVVKEKVESGPRDARKKPTFATRLTDRTAAQGSRIKLTCSVLGSPEPVVEWLRDGLPLVGEHRYKTRCEDGLASLEVLNASPGDSGEFTCVARNLHGEASSTATLKVFAGFEPAPSPPTFTRAIKDSYRFSDDELILECRVRCHPPPKITWLKDGVTLQGSNRHQQSEVADGVCRLIISSPDATADSGQYTCVAENNVWSDQISSAVQFAGRDSYATSRRSKATSRVSRDARRPHISNVLTDHAVPVGGTIALQVEVKGAPKLDVTWLRSNEPLHFLTPKIRKFEDSGVYSLVVTDVTEKEAGLYTCRASNAYGHVDTSATVGIVAPGSVRGGKPAMFINRPDMDMAVAVGEDISVSFRVTGDPRPKVTWMKGIRDITNSQRSLKERLDDYVRLTLKRALVSDAGTYCILAKNIYGCDRAFFTVTIRQRARSLTPSLEWNSQTTSDILRDVRDSIEIGRMKDVPGPVAGEPAVVDSGRNWLTLSWPKSEVRGGAPVVAYRVEAWPLGGEGGARWIEMGVSPTNTFDAFNLKAGTEYKFRVTPRNRYGWGESVTTTAATVVGRKVELPEFTRILPGQLKALQGSSIGLECEVRGDPVPRVQWYRDGMELDDPRFVAHFDGSHLCQLTIQELRDGDSGRYMCEATNRVGRVSTFARLFVVNDPKILEADHKLKRGIQDDQQTGADMPPQFTMRLRDRRVQMTYPVRLTCQVAGCPAPAVTWSKDGDVIKEDDHHAFSSEGNFHTLEMSHTTLEDSGCYSATARNANGAVCCRCHLVVDKGIRAYVAPEFLFELEPEHFVREGGELRLSAQVEAYPTVGVMWHRDGVRLRPSRRTVMTLNHDGTVELALAGVSRRDAGVYSCTATNEVGRAETSTRVNVQATEAPPTADLPAVIGPEVPYSKVPLFLTKPRSTEAVEGDTVIILCEVVGDPKPEVMWLRDWLKPDYYRDAPHFRRVGDGPQYRLEIPHAKLDFTGAYSVIARNCHGEAKAVISLQIYAKGQGKENGMDRSSVKHGKVQTLPVVKRELKDLRCCDGDAVTLECCVQATPAPDIRWEKGGRLLPLGGDFSVEFDGDTARLHIHQVYPEDEGEYTCVAYNELGRAVTSACLVVDVPEEKETLLSRQLSRPVGLLSAGSTPRSTPRTTPSRSKSPSEPRHRDRDGTPPRYIHGESGRHRLKAAAPKFYAVPHNRVAEEGETVRFQCAIAGHPTPWVSWDKDGVLVTPSARLTLSERDDLRILEISEVTVEDAGFYRIALENEVGRIEASARLEVIGHYGGRSRVVRAWSASPRTSPTFGRRLIGSAARVGGRLALACDIRGSPTPASSWYRNGELVVRSSRVTPTWDGRTARLEIENLELEDAGMYTCVAENEMGKTRCSARLVVLDKDDPSQEDRQPPMFLQNLPPEVVATDGELLELQVRLQGTPPLDVVWVKDGVEIADCEDFRYVDRGDGHFGLRLADVFPQDAGTYCCEAYNEHGEATTSSFLSVREGSTSVQFSKRPTPVLTSPGSTVTFCARVDSCGVRPEVSWTVAGRPLDCSRHKVHCEGDVHMLHISPVELCDSGQVTCVARTGMSRDEQCVARTELTVRDDDDMFDEVDSCCMQSADVAPAMLLRGPSDTTALRGDRVVLKATYVGFPRPVVRWLKAGHELSSGDRLTITTADGVTCLVMERITADDSGKYVVSVENDLGADCNYASVAVEGPADAPAGRPTVCCSGNTATVAWCSAPYDGGCMVTGYCVEMRRKKDTEWQVVTERCHSLSYVVAGLIAAEQYVFRVRAENAHGLSEASAESEPFQMGSDEESFMPAFEPRVVTLAPGEEFKANFEVLEELGKGRYGVVHKVAEHATGQKYAAKFIRCIKAKDREKVQEEIDVMNMLQHPKLLQLAAAFESPREVVMVMEYISGGELFERVVADDFTLTERDCILFTRQICEGVDYMHHNYVVHLDLKPENIMCHTRTSHQIKLIDFGLAQKINPDTPVRVLFGTPEFIPPEIINYEPIGVESDMWSVGVICYVLLSGLSPFMGDNDAETFANITRADYDFDDEAFDAISQDAKDFISALLVKRKEKRLTARECLQHIWLAQHDEKMSCVKLCTDKLKKFIIRRKWQKTGNAIRALGRMATLSAATRRNSNASSTSSSPRPSLSGCCGNVSRMSSLNEEDLETSASNNTCSDTNSVINGFGEMTLTKCSRSRLCSERSDSGISDCSSIAAPSAHSHCQCPATLLLSKKFSISEEKETCSEKSSETMIRGACKSGKMSSVACGNIQSTASDMTSGFNGGNNGDNPVSSQSALSNVSPCFSSSAKCSAKKTDSLRQQSSVDSGVHVDVGTCPSPDIPTGNVSARKKELASLQEQQKKKDICDKALRNVSGIVQARSAVLSAAQEKETKPKSASRKRTDDHPPPISTSHEHSTNYHKAMAFWKR